MAFQIGLICFKCLLSNIISQPQVLKFYFESSILEVLPFHDILSGYVCGVRLGTVTKKIKPQRKLLSNFQISDKFLIKLNYFNRYQFESE